VEVVDLLIGRERQAGDVGGRAFVDSFSEHCLTGRGARHWRGQERRRKKDWWNEWRWRWRGGRDASPDRVSQQHDRERFGAATLQTLRVGFIR
jgi:hypothetical protein